MNPLQHLAQQLDTSTVTRQLFFRNDDGGWADSRLDSLCRCFQQLEVPLDIAVIPKALNSKSVALLKSWVADESELFHLHQHGYAHVNHQTEGRSCEFGSARTFRQQREDIVQGMQLMQDAFQEQAEPIFTPPWNRCTSDTPRALAELGFSLLSRISGSDAVGGGVDELPVAVDWLKKRKGVRVDFDGIVKLVSQALAENTSYLGIMLHHEHMDETSRAQLSSLIDVLKRSKKIKFTSMLSIELSRQ